MRGGDPRWRLMCAVQPGRSPHARGRQCCGGLVAVLNGSIPACAGETVAKHRSTGRRRVPACAGETQVRVKNGAQARVDPRMRGGDYIWSGIPRACQGRSPHARGRRGPRCNGWRFPWSIPACAGETPHPCRRRRPYQVDPRMRGGDLADQQFTDRDSGRSPHARGRREKYG